MPVYDDQLTNEDRASQHDRPLVNGAHDSLGHSQEQRQAEVDQLEAAYRDSPGETGEEAGEAGGGAETNLKNIRNKEQNPATPSDNDQVGAGYTGDGEIKSRPRWINRRRATIAGGVVGLLFGGGAFVAPWVVGPLQFIHFAQNIRTPHFSNQDDATSSRMSRLYRYIRTNRVGNTRISALGQHYHTKLLSNMEKIGFKPIYEGRADYFKGMSIDTTSKKSPYKGMSPDEVKLRLEQKYGIKPSTIVIDGDKITVNANGFWSERRATRALIGEMGQKGLSAAVYRRWLRQFGGVTFHPLRPLDRKLDVLARYASWKSARDARIKDGVTATNIDTSNASYAETTDAEGKPVNSENAGGGKEAVTQDSAKTKLEAIRTGKTLKVAVGAGAVTAAAGIACAVKAVYDGADNLRYTQTILPAMRLGMEVITTAGQIQHGNDVDLETLGMIQKDWYSIDESGKKSSWDQAKTIRENNGQSGGVDMDPVVKEAVTAGRPESLAWTQGAEMDALCSTAATVLLTGVDVTIGVVTGGLATTIGGIVAGAVAAKPVLEYASRAVAGDIIDLNKLTGAQFGNIADYGAAFGANASANMLGGTVMSQSQATAALKLSRYNEMADFKNKPLVYKLLSVQDHNSIAAAAIDQISTSPTKNATSIATFFASLPQHGWTAFSTIFTARTHAQMNEPVYAYPFSKVGFIEKDIEKQEFADPYANAEQVEKILDKDSDAYIKRAETCFGVTISKNSDGWGAKVTKDVGQSLYDGSRPKECDDQNDQDWARVRMFITDTAVMEAWACVEADDSTACSNTGQDDTATPNENQANNPENTTSINTDELYSDSTSVPCAPGSYAVQNGSGQNVFEAWHSGNKFMIALCAIDGFPSNSAESNDGFGVYGAKGNVLVNARVSGVWVKLFQDAKAAGRTLGARSSFRTMSHQQSLFKGDTKKVARPGNSNHQSGLAIDIALTSVYKPDGGTCATRARAPNDKTWSWLNDNAAKYGVFQYSRESWHWEAAPVSTTRCGGDGSQ